MPKRRSASGRLVDVHYRRLSREEENFPNVTLAELLRRALKHKHKQVPLQKDVRRRVQDQIPEKPGDVRCWNNVKVLNGKVFGTLCLYRPHELQAMIRAQGTKKALSAFPLSEIGKAEGEDFLRAIAYWMAVNDHFYLIQTSSVQTNVMESYFNWLLKSIDIIPDDQSIILETRIDRTIIGGDLDDLQSIIVGGTVEPPNYQSDDNSDTGAPIRAAELDSGKGEETTRHIAGGALLTNAWGLLESLANPARIQVVTETLQALLTQDPNASLGAEIEFVVHMSNRSKKLQDLKQNMLRVVHSSLRNMPDGAVQAKGKNGIVTNQDIRLKRPRRIKLAALSESAPSGSKSSLLDIEDTFEKLNDVHQCLEREEVFEKEEESKKDGVT